MSRSRLLGLIPSAPRSRRSCVHRLLLGLRSLTGIVRPRVSLPAVTLCRLRLLLGLLLLENRGETVPAQRHDIQLDVLPPLVVLKNLADRRPAGLLFSLRSGIFPPGNEVAAAYDICHSYSPKILVSVIRCLFASRNSTSRSQCSVRIGTSLSGSNR